MSERLTIPDYRITHDDGSVTTRRSFIDGEKVREHAWELYKRLKEYEDACFDDPNEDTSREVIPTARLRELAEAERTKQEQKEPQPLEFGKLAEMEGKPVFDGDSHCWMVIESVYNPDDDFAIDTESNPHAVISFTDGTEMDFDSDFFHLYAHEPKGEHHA